MSSVWIMVSCLCLFIGGIWGIILGRESYRDKLVNEKIGFFFMSGGIAYLAIAKQVSRSDVGKHDSL